MLEKLYGNRCYDPVTATLVTIAVVGAGLEVASGITKYKNAKRQKKAVLEEGKIRAKEKSRMTLRRASQQKSSFLSSGIALTGDEGTTGAVLGEGYKDGLEDINLIKSNYSNKAGSIMSQGRAALLASLGSAAIGLAGSLASAGAGAPSAGAGGNSGAAVGIGGASPSGTSFGGAPLNI